MADAQGIKPPEPGSTHLTSKVSGQVIVSKVSGNVHQGKG